MDPVCVLGLFFPLLHSAHLYGSESTAPALEGVGETSSSSCCKDLECLQFVVLSPAVDDALDAVANPRLEVDVGAVDQDPLAFKGREARETWGLFLKRRGKKGPFAIGRGRHLIRRSPQKQSADARRSAPRGPT